MSPEMKQYEIDRVVNTIKSFGWTSVGSRIEGSKVVVDFEKMLAGMTPDMKKFELDRIAGMIKNIGWNLVSSAFKNDTASVTFEKVIGGTPL
jgi:hypothetical protein